MAVPIGLGIWIAYIGMADGGDPAKIVDRCQRLGISWLAIKSGEESRSSEFANRGLPILRAAKSAGIQVFTWNYSRPEQFQKQIDQIGRNIADGADGHIIDAEVEFVGREPESLQFMQQLRHTLPKAWLAHAPFDCPLYHPAFPWYEFGAHVDAVMPQMYWTEHDKRGAAATITRSETQYHALPIRCPGSVKALMPVGVTYGAGTQFGNPPGTFTREDLETFLGRYADAGRACSLYSYEAASPECWEVLAARVERQRVGASLLETSS